MKTDLTLNIERHIRAYDPLEFDGIRINKFRPRHTFFEYPVECGTTKCGLVDAVRICEYFSGERGAVRRVRYEGEPQILFVFFEIKVTARDFKSKNGHNFKGNLNYYVMPRSLFLEVKDSIPDGVGVICMDSKGGRLKRARSSAFTSLSDEQEKWYLMSALKKLYKKLWRESWI